MRSLEQALAAAARATDDTLDRLLPGTDGPGGRLGEAMRYATLGGGKRLRPFLVIECARLFGVAETGALRVAAAIEMIHGYSLVHDDLPAMDDDDLRRGRPSCHIRFDEATAILAGDALLTLAFGVLADPATHADAEIRIRLSGGLADAAGAPGMVGGQMLDMLSEGRDLDEAGLRRLQAMKTGALITYSCMAPAILAAAPSPARAALESFGQGLGLAFQITDDLLDAVGDAAAAGKAVGKDAARGKATFVARLGVAGARAEAAAVLDRACASLDLFGESADVLRVMAGFVLAREA